MHGYEARQFESHHLQFQLINCESSFKKSTLILDYKIFKSPFTFLYSIYQRVNNHAELPSCSWYIDRLRISNFDWLKAFLTIFCFLILHLHAKNQIDPSLLTSDLYNSRILQSDCASLFDLTKLIIFKPTQTNLPLIYLSMQKTILIDLVALEI